MQAKTPASSTQGKAPSRAQGEAYSSLAEHRKPISIPKHLFGKLIDFLEDKSGTEVIRRKNAFYSIAQPGQPIAWLDSEETVTIVLSDAPSRNSRSNNRSRTAKVRIDDIQLPQPIRVEHSIYNSILCQLVRRSGGGVVRWFNKLYSTRTGGVLAELVSPERIRIFETRGGGLFCFSSEVKDLEEYAPIEVPKEKYIRLLNFLEQEKGDEVFRIGNALYPKNTAELLRTALRSSATIDRETACLLDTGKIAELLSPETVRLRDGTSTNISDLVLRNRIFRRHLYFCASCQSFVRLPFRAIVHNNKMESEKHTLAYVSSYLYMVPERSKQSSTKVKRAFPEILYKFWGIEKGKLASDQRISRNQSSLKTSIPTIGLPSKAIVTRQAATTLLLLAAKISVDGHIVTPEEKIEALRRLESEEDGASVDQLVQTPPQQSPAEILQESPSAEYFGRESAHSLAVRQKFRVRYKIGEPLQRENVSELPELETCHALSGSETTGNGLQHNREG